MFYIIALFYQTLHSNTTFLHESPIIFLSANVTLFDLSLYFYSVFVVVIFVDSNSPSKISPCFLDLYY